MVDGKVHTGDTHTDFQLLVQKTQVDGTNIVVDLSAFSTRQIVFVDPDGSETTVTATIVYQESACRTAMHHQSSTHLVLQIKHQNPLIACQPIGQRNDAHITKRVVANAQLRQRLVDLQSI